MKDAHICSQKIIHYDLVDQARRGLADDETTRAMSLLFKAMGDETRIKILSCLRQTELCVCDLAAVLELSVSAVSHQLRQLKQLNLVKSRREGTVIFYSLNDDHVAALLDIGTEHVLE